MGSISSLAAAYSGLMSNQSALTTTAHNITNVDTPGYVRQQVLMNDSGYQSVGYNAITGFQVGMGTDVTEIRQVRDYFLDISYRDESSRYGYYSAQSSAVDEIESILGETEGEAFSGVLNDLWESVNELSKQPENLETRGSFVENAVIFVEKASMITTQLNEYQTNMNNEIIAKVDEINDLGNQIQELNGTIIQMESTGGNANDYRDARNECLDELSYLVDVSVSEDIRGNLLVSIENVPFVTASDTWDMSVIKSEDLSLMVDPYWPHISSAGPPEIIKKVFNFDNGVGSEYNNDKGELKGMVLSRGSRQANYTDLEDETTFKSDVEPSLIMTVQAQFDNLVHGVVTTINDIMSPMVADIADPTQMVMDTDAPYGMDGDQGTEFFTRSYMTRYDETTGYYNEEDPDNYFSLYTAGNIEVNADILVDYDKISLSKTRGIDGDPTVVEDILSAWQEDFSVLEPGTSSRYNFTDYYNAFISDVGVKGNTVYSIVENQVSLTNQIDNQREELMGVSTDEELSNMITYQHAYNASARVVTVINEMIGRIIDQTGA